MHINDDTIEIAQMDHLDGKEFKLAFRANKPIKCAGETVIDKNSYIQLDNTFLIENYDGLDKFKKTDDTLKVFDKILEKYDKYHLDNEIDENKIVYVDRRELEQLNPYDYLYDMFFDEHEDA